MSIDGGILFVIVAAVVVPLLALVKFMRMAPPERTGPPVEPHRAKAEAAEREVIDKVIDAAIEDVESIDEAPDRERTRRSGDRLRR